MPIEATLLRDAPVEDKPCPKCGAYPIVPMMRGIVQRRKWTIQCGWPPRKVSRPYCAVICEECKEVIAWEEPGPEDYARQFVYEDAPPRKPSPVTIYVNGDGQAVRDAANSSMNSNFASHSCSSAVMMESPLDRRYREGYRDGREDSQKEE